MPKPLQSIHIKVCFRESTSDGLVVLGIPVGKAFGFPASFFLAYLPTLLNSPHSVYVNQITTQSSALLRSVQGRESSLGVLSAVSTMQENLLISFTDI